MNKVVEPLIFKVEIPVEGKARVISAIGDLFREFVENHDGYDLKYDTYEPYYSGHEWNDHRESTVYYTVARDDAEQISASVYTESRDLPYPTREHPRGIEDISAKLCIVLRDPTNEGLLKVFELLQDLGKPEELVSELVYRGRHLHFYVHRTGW